MARIKATLLPLNYVYVGELRNLARKNRIIKKAVEREFESGGDREGVLLTQLKGMYNGKLTQFYFPCCYEKGNRIYTAAELLGSTWLHQCERITLHVSETKENLIQQSKGGKFLLRASFHKDVTRAEAKFYRSGATETLQHLSRCHANRHLDDLTEHSSHLRELCCKVRMHDT